MGLAIIYEEGQTPLDEDEKEGLLIKSITTQGELNEAEQLNIEEAVEWTLRRRFNATDILSERFVRELHKRMYRDVWRWAGEFRHTNKNIGVDKFQIAVQLHTLVDDSQFWLQAKTFPEDEVAIRFKHRIVSIHCFANGNGRHSRLIADVIVSHIFGRPVFTWGSKSLQKKGAGRAAYLQSLKQADKGAMEELVRFARS